jgi:hypothetical protein
MSGHPHCPAQTIVDPPQYVYENYFHPQVVQVIHPIEVIRQHHCVPVPHHVVCVTARDVWYTDTEHRGACRAKR